MGFPKDFVWGAATASYQIEGAAFEDGKGLSVWDMMCRQPGKIWSGDTGEVACDAYHRYEPDVQLMKEIGLQAYRFSISWARVLPDGIGKVNEKGLSYYDRLVDCLLESGIQPWATLFHWDYPYSLYCRGGWLNPDSPDWFAEYVSVIVDRLSDRVSHWMTLNEPQCFIGLGHQSGEHAPGLKLGFADILRICHRVFLAHGKGVKAIRDRAKTQPSIGAALVGVIKIPATDKTEDIEAARSSMFAVTEKNCWNNSWFTDPILKGTYPADGLKLFHDDLPEIASGDLETMCQPLDFFGVNIYHGQTVRADAEGNAIAVPTPQGPPITTMDWIMTPEALYWGPRFFYDRYKIPIVVTENGVAICDWVNVDGRVRDPQRTDFLTRYLRAYRRAIDDGIEAKGYLHWTLTDNFEWAYGYKQRFGLIHVDFATQQRTLKDSAYWYKDVIASHGASLD